MPILKPYGQIKGSGPNLVLLHGWGLHGGIWQNILPELQKSFTVHNIDLPGFGYSPLHNGEYNLEYLVASVESVLDKNQSYHLLGWSLGGLVATAITLNKAINVDKLVTVASSPCFVANDQWKNAMQPSVLKSFMDFLLEDYQGTLIRFLAIQTMGSKSQKEDLKKLKEIVFIHGQPAKRALSGGLKILQDVNLTSQLANLNCPLLRLYGRRDSLVTIQQAKQLDQLLANSPSIIYDNAAHAPFLSSSDQFLKDVKNFLLQDIPKKSYDC